MKTPLALVTALLLTIQTAAQTHPSRHFTIEKLGDDVYAAIATTGGYAICNAGIIDLGDATLIFDPFMTPEAAMDLKEAAATLTDSPVKYVVNSHFHNDHIGGNQVFIDAITISTTKTRDLIAEMLPEEIAYYKEVAPQRLERFSSANTADMTPHQREENIMWIGYFEALVKSIDGLQMTLPEMTFDTLLTLHGTKRSVHLLSYGGGHTESDLFLYLPDAQIAFLGDLLFIQNQPWLGDGNCDHWKSYLDRIARLPLQKLVPGHGPVGTIADITPMKAYMDAVQVAAAAYFKNGTLPENDEALTSPAPYDNWFLSRFFRPNVINMYEDTYVDKKLD